VLWIRDILPLVRIRIRASDQWIRILLFSSLNFKTPTKNFFSAYYFLKVHFHNFSKIKGHKEVTKRRNQGFSYYFCLMKMDLDPFL